jgi:hypothetical protein
MASRLEVQSRAGRLSALALLTIAVSIPAVLFADRAPAGWQLAFVSSHGSGPVRISSNHISGLYPGTKRKLTLTLHNLDRTHSVLVRRVRVREVGTTRRGCAPSRRNLRIRQQNGLHDFRIRAGGTRRITVVLTMPNTVATACQRARFKLQYRAQILRRRTR